MPIESINPANGVILRSYPTLMKKAVTGKIAGAHQAFGRYRTTTIEQRAMWMKKLAGILEHEMEDLATLLTSETGKTIRASRQEILDCAACCRYFAENATQLPSNHEIPMELKVCAVRWQALGVVLAMMPTGSPFWQVFRFLAPALIAGNTVMLRPAATVSQCAMEIELLALRAGFPRDVFQTLLIEQKHMDGLLEDVRLAAVVVTDTVLTGFGLKAKAKFQMKVAAAERTSTAFLVMQSANLFAAVQAGVTARCMDNGESCAAATRFVVHEAVYDDFALLFSAAMEDLCIGNPGKDETVVGPLSSTQAVKELEARVRTTVAAGGTVLTGGQRMVGVGNFFEPTVIVDGPRKKKARSAALFGPVAVLTKVVSLQEAIAEANESAHSLGVSVWTQEVSEQQELALGLECGSVFVNTAVDGDPLLALIGGQDAKGGHELCATMLREFMVARTLVIAEELPEPEMDFDLAMKLADDPAAELQVKGPQEETAVLGLTAGPELVLTAPRGSFEEDLFAAEELAEDVYLPASVMVAATAQAPVSVTTSVMYQLEARSTVTVTAEEASEEELCAVGAGAPGPAVATAPLSFAQMFERALQNRP